MPTLLCFLRDIRELVLNPLHFEFFQNALLGALLASIACGAIGPFVVATRMSSITGGVAHASLGGVGLAVVAGIDPLIGGLGVGILSTIFIARAHLLGDESLDTLISAVWAIGVSVGVIALSFTPGNRGDLTSYLFGSLLFISPLELWILAGCTAVIVGVCALLFRGLVLTVIDLEFAKTRGVPAEFNWFVLLFLATLAVITLIKVVGIVLAMALITIPSALAISSTRSLGRALGVAIALNICCSLAGLFGSYYLSEYGGWEIPAGPLIVGLLALPYLLCRIKPVRVLKR